MGTGNVAQLQLDKRQREYEWAPRDIQMVFNTLLNRQIKFCFNQTYFCKDARIDTNIAVKTTNYATDFSHMCVFNGN